MKHEGLHMMDDTDLFIKYLSKETSESENEYLHKLLSENPEKLKAFEEFELLWNEPASDELELKYGTQDAWEHMSEDIENVKPFKKQNLWPRIAKIAALLLVVVLSSAIYLYLKGEELTIATVGEKQKVELPDGSVVWLNKDSKIRYKSAFFTSNRRITFEGEGFFDISKDKLHPFRIMMNYSKVEVLGTSFYINTRSANDKVEVIVKTGKVAVSKLSADKEKALTVQILEKGDKCEVDVTHNEIQKTLNVNPNYLVWHDNNLTFENIALSEVVSTLNKVYKVNIVFGKPEIGKCPLYAKFNNLTIDEILMAIEHSLNVKVEKQKDAIILTGEGC